MRCCAPGHGVAGADRAPLSALDPAFIASRYHRLVVGRGDHAFEPTVADLRARRMAVVVVARDRMSLSADLRRLTVHRTLAAAS